MFLNSIKSNVDIIISTTYNKKDINASVIRHIKRVEHKLKNFNFNKALDLYEYESPPK